MEFEIAFVDGEVTNVHVTVSGELTVEGNQAWLEQLVTDPRWRPGMRVLLDGTALRPGDFVGRHLQAVAEPIVGHGADWGPGFCAAVVDDPTVFGLIRMWQVATREMEWQTEVFHSRAAARAWLESVSRA